MSAADTARKVVALDEAAAAIAAWRRAGQRVVLATGAFDLMGAAHARALTDARATAERLVVGVLDDRAAAEALGAGGPVVAAEERARLVAALRVVDRVVVLARDEDAALGADGRISVADEASAATRGRVRGTHAGG